MAERKIIVTGGAGFIGSHTVVDLVDNGYEPILLDDFSNSERSVLDGLSAICGREIRCHEVDCADHESVARVFAAEQPIAGVIHFAASKAVAESQQKPLHYYANNLGSLITMLEVMREYAVSDLVFSSSCTVYGQPEKLPVTEDTPIAAPASVYGATKQICEQILCDTVASGAPMRATLLRYFNPIGAHPSGQIGELPRGEPQNLAPIIMQSAAGLRGPVQIYGSDWSTPDGSCIRDYIHVLDLAAAHVKSLDWMAGRSDAPLLEVLNVGTGRGRSVREALAAFERATGEAIEFVVGERREGDIEQIYASVGKAQRLLGWTASRSIEDAMRDAWRWQGRLSTRGAPAPRTGLDPQSRKR
ncbi:MAG: UDP-glucose 4-epimerase GalE [Deltaproteobacteria bacterium]|nr:UDP-glucose 4-epimerase GalE [Deltaproteobacteria bacterium]